MALAPNGCGVCLFFELWLTRTPFREQLLLWVVCARKVQDFQICEAEQADERVQKVVTRLYRRRRRSPQ